MAEATWEKPQSSPFPQRKAQESLKFLIGGALILAAVGYLLVSSTLSGARYFITVDQLLTNTPTYAGQSVRISGVVIGETIRYDDENLIIDFEIAHVPDVAEDLGMALHLAASDPNARRIAVHVEGQVMPDLLQHEAQAILTGTLGADGVFYATELLLKCPTRFTEENPGQATPGG